MQVLGISWDPVEPWNGVTTGVCMYQVYGLANCSNEAAMFWKGGLLDHQYGGRDLRKFSVDHERVGHAVGLLCWLLGDSVIFNGAQKQDGTRRCRGKLSGFLPYCTYVHWQVPT